MQPGIGSRCRTALSPSIITRTLRALLPARAEKILHDKPVQRIRSGGRAVVDEQIAVGKAPMIRECQVISGLGKSARAADSAQRNSQIFIRTELRTERDAAQPL